MGWRDNRRRSVCKKIMFTPEEWEQARRIHERWARNIPVYRRWGDFARQTLMHGALMNVSVTLASDPEVFKAKSMEAWRYLGMAQMTNSSITFFRSGPVAYRAYERLGKSCRALRRRSLDAP